MHRTSRVPYFVAGLLMTNSAPHFAAGITGRRMLTPFGRDSSPSTNLLWSGLNLAVACLLLLRADRDTRGEARGNAWLIALEAGCLFWGLWMVSFESLAGWLQARAKNR